VKGLLLEEKSETKGKELLQRGGEPSVVHRPLLGFFFLRSFLSPTLGGMGYTLQFNFPRG
jgi:hypothetical protein